MLFTTENLFCIHKLYSRKMLKNSYTKHHFFSFPEFSNTSSNIILQMFYEHQKVFNFFNFLRESLNMPKTSWIYSEKSYLRRKLHVLKHSAFNLLVENRTIKKMRQSPVFGCMQVKTRARCMAMIASFQMNDQ